MSARSRLCGFSLLASLASLAPCPGCSAPAETVDASADAARERDAGARADADVDAGSAIDAGALHEAGAPSDAARDAGATVDAEARNDGGIDGSVASRDAASDVETDGSAAMPDAAPVDAGPPRPVGDPIDVTGSRCALDEAGQFWCWGRWAPVEDVRLLGSGFDSAAGSCALRGPAVWCAEFSTLTMIPVVDGSDTLRVERLAEYSDLALGCGVRRVGAWYRAVCWDDGGGVTEISGDGEAGLQPAVIAPGESRAWAIGRYPLTAVSTGTPEAYDINPDTICTSSGTRVDCSGYGRARGLLRPAGDHYSLGFSLSCANTAGNTRCSNGSTAFDIATPSFTDQAVTWPIGSVDPARPVQARGLCIGGSGIRCYTSFGTLSATLAYTVNW